MSIQLGVGPHSASSLIRSNSSFQVESITTSNSLNTNELNTTNINVINDINISGILNITNGNAIFTNTNLTLDQNSNLTVSGSMELSNLNIISNLNVNNLNVTNDVNIKNNLNITNNLNVSNNTILSGSLLVSNNVLYVDNVNNRVGINTTSPTESLHVDGSSKINNNLEVRGSMVIGGEDNFNDTNFEDYSKWGSGTDVDTQIYSKFEYVGIGTQNPEYFLDVSGIINTKDRYFINGNEVLDSITLGSSIVNSNLEKLGLLQSLNVTGQSNFYNNLNISTNLNITGNLIQTGNSTIDGDINVTGDINLYGNLKIGETFELNNQYLSITEDVNIINHELNVNNLVLNSEKKLPPKRLSGNSQFINSFYGQGDYELTTSSTQFSLFLYQLMDEYTDTFFRSDLKYNSTTGLYTGSTNFNNLGVLGEWFKIKLPQSYPLKRIKVSVLNAFIDSKNPKEIVIYGSNDDINWTHIQTNSNILWDLNQILYSFQNFTITNNTSYQYYTFIIPKVGGKDNSGSYTLADSFAIAEFELYFTIDSYNHYNLYTTTEYVGIGITNPQHTLDVKGNFNIDGKFLIENEEIFDTNIISNLREYPPQIININSLKINTKSETIETGTISQNEVTYGAGDYEIYYTGFSPFLFPNSIGSNVFNKIIDQNIYFRTIDSYDGPTGNYLGTNSLAGYSGEYIIIKLPQSILIKSFRIYNNLYDSEYMSPRNYKILGSLNKVSWDLLYEKENEYFSPTNYGFVENNVITENLYNYFAIVVSRVGNYDTSYSFTSKRALKIQDLKFYGVQYNDYGINYNTGLYINGPLKVNGSLDILSEINLNQALIQNLNVTDSITSDSLIVETITSNNLNTTSINVIDSITSNNIYIDNLIGLGVTENINGKLEISGNYGSVSLNADSYVEIDSVELGLGTTTINSYSIYANGKIAASEFNAISDKRVKNIISDRDFNDDKQFIENVNIYNFEYIDKLNYGTNKKIGFMAQDLERLNSNLINYSTNFIPNIFKKLKIINKEKIILDTDYDININDILKIEVDNKIVEKKIKDKKENYIIIDKINQELDEIFIYGKKVNDFKTINFEQLIAINMNSIKNLYNEIKEIKENQKTILNHLNINK